MKQQAGMTLIVKTVTRISVWLILLYGIYIILHGHLSPGGGFAGGVIIALAFLNVMLAFGRDFIKNWLNIEMLHDIDSSSAMMFLAVGILGMAFGGSFLANFISHGTLFNLVSSGTIQVLNIVIGLKVGMGLFIVVWALALFHLDRKEMK
ncbi:MAG: MnhB domain-containing protein [Candidatus Marinimicrobia bacterium]|jgi:multicomponent Na+:H+ antiporter subunit B|nr:MnhB domain-containing protein [Candidatus Neomarinimicrobiota bacterium]